MAPSECLASIKTRCGGFQICGEVGSLWSYRRRGTKHAPPAPPNTPPQCSVFVVPLRLLPAEPPRAAAMAAAMVNPLKRLRIGGDRLYIRVPQFPLSSPDVCEILLLQQTD